MNREEMLNHQYKFVEYERFWDADYSNRYILEIPLYMLSFFRSRAEKEISNSFALEKNVFYITDEEDYYAFKLDDEFASFEQEMKENRIPVIYITFAFPGCDTVFDFSFIGVD